KFPPKPEIRSVASAANNANLIYEFLPRDLYSVQCAALHFNSTEKPKTQSVARIGNSDPVDRALRANLNPTHNHGPGTTSRGGFLPPRHRSLQIDDAMRCSQVFP